MAIITLKLFFQENYKSNHQSSKNERKIGLLTNTLHYFIGSINDVASKTSVVKDVENLGIKKVNKSYKIFANLR